MKTWNAPKITLDGMQTPALIIRMDAVRRNLERMTVYLDGDLARWRPHVKTSKIPQVQQCMLDVGIRRFKAATTREAAILLELAESQFSPIDLLMAFPLFGANLRRFIELAETFSKHRLSIIIDSELGIRSLSEEAKKSSVEIGVFLDLNPGMDRTGTLNHSATTWKSAMATALASAPLKFRGLHWYDGQIGAGSSEDRRSACHQGLDHLGEIVAQFRLHDMPPAEIITSGTPGFLHSLHYSGWSKMSLHHQVSPGTVIYWDAASEAELPELDFEPAAFIISRIVSQPRPDRLTCDAGHKTISADRGDPIATIVGHPELVPMHPSEEHLPLNVTRETSLSVGDCIALVPTHVCPTINNADQAILVDNNDSVIGTALVRARGHELMENSMTRYLE